MVFGVEILTTDGSNSVDNLRSAQLLGSFVVGNKIGSQAAPADYDNTKGAYFALPAEQKRSPNLTWNGGTEEVEWTTTIGVDADYAFDLLFFRTE